MTRRRTARTFLLVLAAAFVIGCEDPSPQSCRRYDLLALTPENSFAGRIDWKSDLIVDRPAESIEVSVTLAVPVHEPLELVHVVGDSEADRWSLDLSGDRPSIVATCVLSPAAGTSVCAEGLGTSPVTPGGFWQVNHSSSAVVEAGLSFMLCD